MTTVSDILLPECLRLSLSSANEKEAVWDVSMLLKTDTRVADWRCFHDHLKTTLIETGPTRKVFLAHARTDAVTTMVMSAGRRGNEEAGGVVEYFFVIGVPLQMAADYLRIIGALARVFRDNDAEQALRKASEPGRFISILAGKAAAL